MQQLADGWRMARKTSIAKQEKRALNDALEGGSCRERGMDLAMVICASSKLRPNSVFWPSLTKVPRVVRACDGRLTNMAARFSSCMTAALAPAVAKWRRSFDAAAQDVAPSFASMRDLPAMCACYALVALFAVMVLRPDLVLRVAMAVLP